MSSGPELSAAAMIKRFREGKPMSREERRTRDIGEMWWIDKDKPLEDDNSDSIESLPRPSPLKPMNQSRPTDVDKFKDDLDPLSHYRFSDSFDNRRSNRGKQEVKNLSWRHESIDDLIAGDISDTHRMAPIFRSSGSQSKYFRNDDTAKGRTHSSLLNDSYEFKHPSVMDSLEGNRDVLHTRDGLGVSVDTLGSAGFKALLAPHLKLDGKDITPTVVDGGTKMDDINSGLEVLIKTLGGRQEKFLTEHGVDETVTQVCNRLQADMSSFTAAFKEKHSAEEAAEAAQRARDEEMREAGRQEERARAVLDYQYFRSLTDEPHSSKRLPERDASQNSPESGEECKVSGKDPSDPSATSVNSRPNGYRHGVYNRPPWREQLLDEICDSASTFFPDNAFAEAGSQADILRRGNRGRKVMASSHTLHLPDPPAAWLRRPCSSDLVPPPKPDPPAPDSDHEKETQIEGPSVRHSVVSRAARDVIEVTLNSAMKTLSMRLPEGSEVEAKETSTTMIANDPEVKKSDAPIPSSAPDTGKVTMSKDDLKTLDDLLDKHAADLSPHLHSILDFTPTGRAPIAFHTMADVETAWARPAGRRVRSLNMQSGNYKPSAPFVHIEMQAPPQPPPVAARHTKRPPNITSSSQNYDYSQNRRERSPHISNLQNDSSFHSRERYLRDMRAFRLQFSSSC